jgi:hypothetical protein
VVTLLLKQENNAMEQILILKLAPLKVSLMVELYHAAILAPSIHPAVRQQLLAAMELLMLVNNAMEAA